MKDWVHHVLRNAGDMTPALTLAPSGKGQREGAENPEVVVPPVAKRLEPMIARYEGGVKMAARESRVGCHVGKSFVGPLIDRRSMAG